MISIQNISKSYSNKRVLSNFSLEIPNGQTVSLIGSSGSGKSTVIRIVMGLIKSDSGRINILGKELNEKNELVLRQKMGYVIQKGGLFPHLTARENCSLLAKHLGWNQQRINSRIEELAVLTNIEHPMLDRLPLNLSGGQQQRISLMRALMLDPDILLLDEPLGSIDPLVRFELQSDLKTIFKTLDKTVLFVTHDLNEAAYLGDEIVLLNEGKLIQKGKIQELIKNPANEFVQRFVNAQRSYLENVK
ncbi:MAG: ATP-binding cassette domain-containing protein [Balneolaceae bacterium]